MNLLYNIVSIASIKRMCFTLPVDFLVQRSLSKIMCSQKHLDLINICFMITT